VKQSLVFYKQFDN